MSVPVRPPLVAALALLAGLTQPAPAGAQGFDLFRRQPQTAQQAPPADIPGEARQPEDDPTAALLLRVNRLEDQLRQANGRIEQLENAERRLEDQLQKFRQDVEFRFRERSGEAAPAAGAAATATASAGAPATSVTGAPAAVATALPPDVGVAPTPKRSDAFNPASQPNAPGAPQPLGATAPSAPLVRPAPAARLAAGPPLELGGAPPPGEPLATTGPTIVGSGVAMLDAPREQYNAAVQAFQSGQYQQAEDGFRAFMTANPGHRLTPDALFYIGESYFQRARPREAAEQYLKVTTDYAKSSRAPESMVRLGQTLIALGNKDQACETFAEFGRRYPAASASVKRLADREMAKDHC